jgi:hypothetical protein
MDILPGNLAEFQPTPPRRAREMAPAGRRLPMILGLLVVLGGAVGFGAYRWVLSLDDLPPPPPSLATPSQTDTSPDLSTPIVPDSGTPQLVVTGLLGNQPESQNWAGYAATEGGYTSVAATWSVPDLGFGSAPGIDAAWVGIGGVRSRDLIQAGTLRTVLANGATQQEAWVELLPRPPETVPLTLDPGDAIRISIEQQGPETWLITYSNLTSGKGYQTTKRYASSLSSAEWVEEAPSAGRRRTMALDNFGTVRFSAASAVRDLQVVNIAQAHAHAITMITPNGQHLAEPSLVGSDGESFSVTRTAIPSPAPRGR